MAKLISKRKVLTAPSLIKFLKIVSDIRKDWNFARDEVGGPWFRGQQRPALRYAVMLPG